MGLGCAVVASPRRSSGGGTPGMAFWPPEWPTRHYSVRKRKRGVRKCSPRARDGWSCCAGWTSARTSGGSVRSSRRKVEEGASRRLGGLDRCVVLLRGRWRGQRRLGWSGDRRRQGISVVHRVTCNSVTGKIQHSRGRRLEMVAAGLFLGPRRSWCEAWPRLRCSGVVWPRQSRGMARRSGAELGFLGGGCGWGRAQGCSCI